jgi:hypothetical protein
MANEIEGSNEMKTQDNAQMPVAQPAALSMRECINIVNAKYEGRRQRSTTAAAKAAAKAPAWAQRIWAAQQAADTFFKLYLETMKFAATKSYKLSQSMGGGYDLRRDRKMVLRSRPMFAIVEYLGAQHIWADV